MKSKLFHIKQTLLLLVVVVVLSMILFSCKTTKISGSAYPPMNPDALLSANDSSYVQGNILDLRFKAKLTDAEGTQRATCYVRLYPDSLIWLSIRSMSFEGMRMLLTPDSLKFVDRMNKKAYQGDYTFFSRRLSVTPEYELLQNMLLQKRHVYNNNLENILNESIKTCRDSSRYCLWLDAEKPQTDSGRIKEFSPVWTKQYFRFYPETHRIAETEITSTLTGKKLIIAYEKAMEFDGMEYPESIHFEISGEKPVRIEMQTQKAECCDSVKTPFKIPDNYDTVTY
jgi:hypothetical protein